MKRRSLITGAVVATAAVLMTATCVRSFDYQHSGNCRPFDVVNIRIGNNEFAVPPALKPEIAGYDHDRVLFQKGNVPQVEGRLRFCPRPPMTRIDASKLRVEYPVLKSRNPSYLTITDPARRNGDSSSRLSYSKKPKRHYRTCNGQTRPIEVDGFLFDRCGIRWISYRGLYVGLSTDHAGILSKTDDGHIRSVYSFLDNMKKGAK